MSAFSVKFDDFSPDKQLLQVKTSIVRGDLPQILGREQRKGFPKKYQLLVRQRGRETRRQLKTLSPYYFKIGTMGRPTEFNFVAGEGFDTMLEAVAFASALFTRRAPYVSGEYLRSARVTLNGAETRVSAINKEKLTEASRVFFGPTVPYAAVIESGHYTKYYQPSLRGGIMRYIINAVRDKFGASVSVRLVYVFNGVYSIPQIEFGPAGAFAFKLARTGARARAARRRGNGR